MVEQAAVCVGQRAVATSHDAFGHSVEILEVDVEEAAGAAAAERRNKRGREAFADNVAADAHHRAGVERGVDGGLAVVAHNQAAELQAGVEEAAGGIVPHAHFGVIVLEVGSGGAGAEVAPLADYGVTQEAVVGLVGVAPHHHVVDFAAHLAVRADGGAAVHERAHVELGMFAQGQRAAQPAAFHHHRVATDVDGSLLHVDGGATDFGALFDEELRGVAKQHVRGVERLGGATGSEAFEVHAQHLVVEHEDVVDMVDGQHITGEVNVGGNCGAAVSDFHIIGLEPLAGMERSGCGSDFGGGYHVAGHKESIVGGNFGAGEEFTEIVGCIPVEVFVEEVLPTFSHCRNA